MANDDPKESSSSGPADGTEFKQLTIDVLDADHCKRLEHALNRVLSTEVAEIAYAQVIDGLPIASVSYDSSGGPPPNGHPIHDQHVELCPGMLDKAREFRNRFNPQILKLDPSLLMAYQAAAPGSRAFNTRLIELVAVSVHQIAVILFKLDAGLHKEDGITDWAPPKSDKLYWRYFPEGPLPTLLVHPWYINYQQYPEGAADLVGYWAEARILGGVVSFDRRKHDDGTEIDPDAVYMHPDRADVTYRIYKLLPEQKQALLEFLTSKDTSMKNPLPILGDKSNRVPVDPEESSEFSGIYRDIWERKELSPDLYDTRAGDLWDRVEYPTQDDKYEAALRARDRLDRLESSGRSQWLE